mgnify:CR=1 FL=1
MLQAWCAHVADRQRRSRTIDTIASRKQHRAVVASVALWSSRVRARLRRGVYEQDARRENETLQLGDLSVNPVERLVQRGDRAIALSQREFELLLFLVKHSADVQSRQTILDAVWGAPFVGDPNTLDVYMGYLRRKIESPDQPALLHTIRGVGFMARLATEGPDQGQA